MSPRHMYADTPSVGVKPRNGDTNEAGKSARTAGCAAETTPAGMLLYVVVWIHQGSFFIVARSCGATKDGVTSGYLAAKRPKHARGLVLVHGQLL